MAVNKSSPAFVRRSNEAEKSARLVEANLKKALQDIKNLTFQGVKDVVEEIYKGSQVEVPVSIDGSHGKPAGTLKKSGYRQVELTATGIEGIVGYDRNDEAPYAVFVHEIMRFKHTNPATAKAKFLQDPATEVAGRIAKIIAGKISKRLK